MLQNRDRNRTWLKAALPLLAMILSNPILLDAQNHAPDDAHLLESGKAERVQNPAKPKEIKIVSYNIRWRTGEELQQIVRWLKETKDNPPAAIIGLQEVDRGKKRTAHINHAKKLANELGMHYAWAAPRSAKGNKQKEEETGVALLTVYPLTEITRLVLTNSGPGGRSRVALGATIKIEKISVRAYSVHGETRLPMTRKIDQLRIVMDDLAKFPKADAAIVMGDFNIWELPAISDVRKLFTTAGFTTPVPDDEPTFRQPIVMFTLKLKLDWLWVRGLTPQSYGIDRTMKVSDHYPVWTVVKLPADNLEPANAR